jgi:NCS1 family nucleobase:cation symporter-1
VLVPWSSINLADYYLVRDGRYSITDIFAMNGIYGKYNVATLVIYFVAIASTVPFMDVSFYHSYFAKLLNADISWIPALVVPGTLYYLVNRHIARAHFVSPATNF